MAYQRYGRRQYVDNTKYMWAAGFGLLLIAFGLIFNAIDAAELRDLVSKIASLETRRAALFVQQPQAEAEVNQYAPEFAQHWSEGFSGALADSRKSLDPNGSVHVLQVTAQQAIHDNKRNVAQGNWEDADAKLNKSEQIIGQILGPPKYYDGLKQKSDAVANGYLQQVQSTIAQDRAYVASMPQKLLCGSYSTLSYAGAGSLLDQAQQQLDTVAKPTAQLISSGGVADLPLAYDQAQQAQGYADSAKATANQLAAQADSAAAEIATCDTKIAAASSELIGAYDSTGAQSNYDQAQTERKAAVSACALQDFAGVTSHATSCTTYASQSISDAQPPPPTAVPSHTDTSSPSINFGSNNGGGGGIDFGSSSSGSGDSFGSGGSNDSFGSGSSDDGFGGGDSFGSGDGFGGGDSFGSGDGFDP